MIGSDCIENLLYQHGVRHVFGYSGSMMLRIMDSIYRKGRIEFHHTFNEQGAALAADGYARMTGKLGVVLVTSGPGAINALAGVADAYLDSVPLLCITGQDYSSHVQCCNGARMNGFQDLDIAAISKTITKYSVQIQSQGEMGYEMEKAMEIAVSGRKGPVLVDIPMDFQFMEMPESVLRYFGEADGGPMQPTIDQIHMLTEQLQIAQRPLIITGGGTRMAGASRELSTLVERTGIPLVCTLNGLDCGAPIYGFAGMFGKTYANLTIKSADLIIAIGVRFGNQQVGKLPVDYTSAQILHIDVDKSELGRIFKEETGVLADAKVFLQKLQEWADAYSYRIPAKWEQILQDWKKELSGRDYVNCQELMDPVHVVQTLCKHASVNDVVVADVGQNEMWTAQGFVTGKGLRFLCSSGYGTMGFSLPCAIGASYANSTGSIYSFMGDGGFQMNMQELAFLKLHPRRLKCIVFNNGTLGMMREVQKLYYDSKFYGNNEADFFCPDLQALAHTYDLHYFLLSCNDNKKIYEEIAACQEPCIVDCRVSRDSREHSRADDASLLNERLRWLRSQYD